MSTGTANFLSGGFGAFAFWFAAMPADNIKKWVYCLHRCIWAYLSFSLARLYIPNSRMMAKPLPSPGSAEPYIRPTFMSVAREIRAREGLPGFYRGLTPTLLRAFPVNAAAFFVFEGIMRSLGAEKVTTIYYSSFGMSVTNFPLFSDQIRWPTHSPCFVTLKMDDVKRGRS
jgi:solute carrier family 25 (mitochondrial carnitine/acylcarnitine transporter), member 20/29